MIRQQHDLRLDFCTLDAPVPRVGPAFRVIADYYLDEGAISAQLNGLHRTRYVAHVQTRKIGRR